MSNPASATREFDAPTGVCCTAWLRVQIASPSGETSVRVHRWDRHTAADICRTHLAYLREYIGADVDAQYPEPVHAIGYTVAEDYLRIERTNGQITTLTFHDSEPIEPATTHTIANDTRPEPSTLDLALL
ncbi:hypothetical protein [Prescottella agglutinans]|uniref:Uncharacterized protein n=1 Tax=Prescottella agglutinans TaxID=1644129 RepID=A0ABT6MI97_9NOCA|nr:hypothetical protein [Prescottella agglutinans]MDH6284052.1 hypothetical protein [Prescottella agglutinans]